MGEHEMATTRKRILINGTDSSYTDAGDNIILDGTDSSSTDVGSYLDYETTTYFYTTLTDIAEETDATAKAILETEGYIFESELDPAEEELFSYAADDYMENNPGTEDTLYKSYAGSYFNPSFSFVIQEDETTILTTSGDNLLLDGTSVTDGELNDDNNYVVDVGEINDVGSKVKYGEQT
jgi:hypothetical protein